MKKNAKKLQKNLHISKKCCTFAPDLIIQPIAHKQTTYYKLLKINNYGKFLSSN